MNVGYGSFAVAVFSLLLLILIFLKVFGII